MLSRQFPIDKAPLVQPLMRTKLPRTLVDRKFLSANCLACAFSAGPNHVPTHGIKTHGIKHFRVVHNLGHHRNIPVLSKSATTRPCAPQRDLTCLQLGNASIRADYGRDTSSRPCAFAATIRIMREELKLRLPDASAIRMSSNTTIPVGTYSLTEITTILGEIDFKARRADQRSVIRRHAVKSLRKWQITLR